MNYIPFEQRMSELHMLTCDDRRTISSIIYIIKIMRRVLETKLSNILNNSLYSVHVIRITPSNKIAEHL